MSLYLFYLPVYDTIDRVYCPSLLVQKVLMATYFLVASNTCLYYNLKIKSIIITW